MSTICQYCIQDAETDPELAEEIAAARRSTDEGESNYGGDDCDICGG